MIFSAKRPDNLGIKNGRLATCPESPNCVSSQLPDNDSHYIAPFQFKEDPLLDMQILAEMIEKIPGHRIICFKDDYLHVESTTRLMRYIDDLEFYWSPEDQVCHVRSASRIGYSDLGKNRQRLEQIRALFNKQ